jgi:predicted acetyltransferase
VTDFRTESVDAAIAERLRTQGLRMDLLDMNERSAVDAWSDAANRGFHGGQATPERYTESAEAIRARRNTGVWDESSSTLEPVGTSNSWISRLGVPGGRTLDAWAISTVTVASTHHKRGIARALVEAELAAASQHVPMAMLTVSESSLYGRYGFAPAAFAADYEFDVRRVRWSGPIPDGRVEYITLEQFAEALTELHERLVPTRPGEIDIWPLRVKQRSGLTSEDGDRAKKLRAVRYVDNGGATRGIAVYKISGGDDDFVSHQLDVETLVYETADAAAALWRYVLEVPLVAKVRVEHRPVDDPVQWMINDWRAATVKLWEHQYLRILDVPAVFEARGYIADGDVIFDVSDPYGYATGRWHLHIRDGAGRVTPAEDVSDVPTIELGVAELSALYLGGVRAGTLVASGRVRAPGGSADLDRLIRTQTSPFLSIWY